MALQLPVHPDFSQYGPQLGAKLTAWLFGDPQANPYAADIAKWFDGGRVAIRDFTVQFASIAPAVSTTVPTIATDPAINMGGGRNVIIFGRSASCVLAAAPAAAAVPNVLPNALQAYVDIEIQRQSGFIDTQRAPLNNVFGYGWAPHVMPVPECWLGNELRSISIFNRSADTIKVDLTYHIALLDTGR